MGTPAYMSPEIVENNISAPEKVDIFAAGVILFSLISGSSPFTCSKNNDRFYRYIHQNQAKYFWKLHSKKMGDSLFSEELKDLI